MLAELPMNIQQMIYNKLPAADRARFCMAVPRDVRNQLKRKFTVDERKLNGLSKAIEKKKVRRLSVNMRDFLRTCNADDPTCEPILAAFPDVKDIMIPLTDPFIKSLPVTKSVLDKMLDGTITVEDLKEFTVEYIQELNDFQLNSVVCRLSVQSFEFMWKNSVIFKEYIGFKISNGYPNLILNCLVWDNIALCEHLLANEMKFGIDRERMNTEICDWTTRYLTAWRHAEFLLKHFPYSRESLEKVWSGLMDDMCVDSANVVEQRLDQMEAA